MRTVVLLFSLLLLLAAAASVSAVGGGDVTFTPAGADPVKFSHDHHAKARGLKCAVCHFQKYSKGQGYEMKKEAITKRDFCANCHNGMKSFDSDLAKNCVRCHKK